MYPIVKKPSSTCILYCIYLKSSNLEENHPYKNKKRTKGLKISSGLFLSCIPATQKNRLPVNIKVVKYKIFLVKLRPVSILSDSPVT